MLPLMFNWGTLLLNGRRGGVVEFCTARVGATPVEKAAGGVTPSAVSVVSSCSVKVVEGLWVKVST